MILVTFALPQEGAVFKKRLKAKRAINEVITGSLNGRSVAVFWLGLGFKDPERFRHTLSALRPELIINSGFAGALRPDLRAGDFILAENLTTARLMERLRAAPFFNGIGRFYEVQDVIDQVGKARLLESGNSVAIDMESDRVAAICRAFPYPYITARMISDRADESIPGLFVGKGIRRPQDVSDAILFAARMLKLRKTLADRLGKMVMASLTDGDPKSSL
jgi:nucleoside phosphorylase